MTARTTRRTPSYSRKASAALCLALLLGACSSNTGGEAIQVSSVVQDLDLDPSGLTTRIQFSQDPGSVAASNFGTDGAQLPVTVVATGTRVDVTWDSRVTPSHQLRVSGVLGVSTILRDVTTSDDSAPTFALSNGIQDTSDMDLGGDTLTVTFSGPRVIEALAEDVSNWQLSVGATSFDLTGSSFDLDPATQVMSVTLGAGAGLHASFNLAATGLMSVADTPLSSTPVAGTASGDSTAPTLTSAEQDLALDDLGRVVDFTFSEAMDPSFAVQLGGFQVNDHASSSELTLIASVTQPADNVLRVTTTNPVVPGLDDFTLSGVFDQHGNAFAGTTAFTNPAPLPNAYTSVTGTTVENTGGDTIEVVTDQALDPDFAVGAANWSVMVDGNPVDLALQTVSYDVVTHSLRVELDFDMQNGDMIDVTAINQFDIDGEAFLGAAAPVAASGDAAAPAVTQVLQNRALDPAGRSVDVTFGEDLDALTAEVPGAYAFTPAVVVTSAVLDSNNTVTLVTDTVITPGDFTLVVDGTPQDLAGNPMGAPQGPLSITSSDVTAPGIATISGSANEGANNDTLVVQFDDDMIEAEVETPGNWSFESPIGTPIDISGASYDYSPGTRRVTVVFDSGQAPLKLDDDMTLSLASMRDVGGNAIQTAPTDGVVDGERNLGAVHTVWRDAASTDELVVRFTEPCDLLEDLYDAGTNPTGTRYALRDAGGTLRGYPVSSTALDDGLGVRISFGFTVALTDTLDVLAATDLAGNVVFPAIDQAIEAEVSSEATLFGAATGYSALEGAQNDSIVIQFTEPVSPWGLLSTGQVDFGGVDVSAADVAFNGTDELTLTLQGDLTAGALLSLSQLAGAAEPIRTAQGVPTTVAISNNFNVGGDMLPPTQAGSLAVLDRFDDTVAYVVFNEAVHPTLAPNPANYSWNGLVATSATLFGPRAVQLGFASNQNPSPVIVQAGSAVDRAGNMAAGSLTLAITGDTSPAALTSVVGTSVEGRGGDYITIGFDEAMDTGTLFAIGRYKVTNGSELDLVGTSFSYDAQAMEVALHLPPSLDLDATQALSVEVSFVEDVPGNKMPRVTLAGTIVGDLSAPVAQASFINLRADASGRSVDLLFNEEIDTAFAGSPANWSASGGQIPLTVEVLGTRHLRLVLNAPLGASDTLDLAAGLTDSASNPAGVLSFDPEE